MAVDAILATIGYASLFALLKLQAHSSSISYKSFTPSKETMAFE
jgi:hypothetical protein